eukprot:CAMPEP_0197386932 /NCGR_PEP_ID=MMETSP1165-20131217/195_1 /TAXON_ID=284809 /ORGANISM="Chrysocystis fragilis, Strain CCMP3189" /LENGTH=214 /DNA_ID=CAMNT_0042912209 /DNA_START=81 /DNA_END=725 /DNA_ORIENTATION=-
MPRFGAVSPKQIVEQATKNDPSLTSINLSSNALFKMKTFEYCKMLAEALSANTHVTELVLNENEITDADCEWLKELLATNKSITTMSLEKNKISSEGCALIAAGLATNSTLVALSLLNNGPFGESCMDTWLKTFNDNITLYDLKWRLNSRSSFALNSAITRNRSVSRLRKEGKDWQHLLPDHLRDSKPVPPQEPAPEEPAAPPAEPQLEVAAEA